jgi:hypothetical protein
MNTKPVTPIVHGIIDYVFSAIQIAGPSIVKLNNTATKTYGALGLGFLAVNALTDTAVGIKPVISFKGHQKADASFLAALALLTLAKPIREDKKALYFHLGFLATAIGHYALTDYNTVPENGH